MVLSACAIGPKFDVSDIDLSVTPQQAVLESEILQGTQVLWGGIIIASTNLKDATQFEILAYPLSTNQKPKIDETPWGRFLTQKAGYLETADYTPGRLITVRGTLQDKRLGSIGESKYTYPVINISRHYLWPKRGEAPETTFHFGVGVIFSN